MDSVRVHRLSAPEVEALTRLYDSSADADVRLRCQIVGLSNWGCSTAQIASIVDLSDAAVGDWIRRYEAGGVLALSAEVADATGDQHPG